MISLLGATKKFLVDKPQLKRIIGQARTKYFSGRLRVEYLPEFLFCEPTNKCNLRCEMCFLKKYDYDRCSKDLQFDGFKQILDNILASKNRLKLINLQGTGEPLLNRDFFTMTQYAVKNKIMVKCNTNGTRVKGGILDQIFANNLEVISFSIDTLNEEKFKILRGGAKLKQILDHLETIIKVRSSMRRRLPQIHVRMLLSKLNINDLEDMIKYFSKLKIDQYTIQDLIGIDEDISRNQIDEKQFEEVRRLIKKSEKLPFKIRMENFYRFNGSKKGPSYCVSPWKCLNITAEGYITPCCILWDHRVINFGNVFKKDVYDIWNGPEYQSFRKEFSERRPKVCENCTVY
jgi:MoaA/NifB/PqqE/SkfB family radical SAM enzyme